MLVDRPASAAQRSWVAHLGSETPAAHPYVDVVTNALAFHFVGLIADTKREDVWPRQDSVYFNLAPVEATRPPALNLLEIEAVILPVNGNFVGHKTVVSS
jgi:hypothetical protein